MSPFQPNSLLGSTEKQADLRQIYWTKYEQIINSANTSQNDDDSDLQICEGLAHKIDKKADYGQS